MKDFFKRLLEGYKCSAPKILPLFYLALPLLACNYDKLVNGSRAFSYKECILCVIIIALINFAVFITEMRHGSGIVSDYDKRIIGRAFSRGSNSFIFYEGLQELLDGNYSDAMEVFRELDKDSLSDQEAAVLSFYHGICYYRMGYPTNAAHAFEEAYDNGVSHTDALLMAARNYGSADNFFQAERLYTKLIDMKIAEDIPVYPFLYNELARLYLGRDNAESAEKYFNISIEKGLDPITAKGGLALCRLLSGKPEEALYLYRAALMASIPDPQGYKEYCSEIAEANGYGKDFFTVTGSSPEAENSNNTEA